MTGFEVCIVVLLVGALLPAVAIGATGRPTNRLIGLELSSAIISIVFVVFAQVSDLSYELILPLVLVPLSFAGTLVYTRLLRPRQGAEER